MLVYRKNIVQMLPAKAPMMPGRRRCFAASFGVDRALLDRGVVEFTMTGCWMLLVTGTCFFYVWTICPFSWEE